MFVSLLPLLLIYSAFTFIIAYFYIYDYLRLTFATLFVLLVFADDNEINFFDFIFCLFAYYCCFYYFLINFYKKSSSSSSESLCTIILGLSSYNSYRYVLCFGFICSGFCSIGLDIVVNTFLVIIWIYMSLISNNFILFYYPKVTKEIL